jgi:predicted GNAT family N-acyltransferase
LIDAARQRGVARVILNAQTYAIAFYEKAGFEAVGAEFLDAGIPHRRMILQLDHPSSDR